ncbi:MAG: VWA domain-containing protein [Jhaorihella sp.]
MTEALQLFHFLRPWLLLAIPLAVLLWVLVRRRNSADDPQAQGIAPHLARAMTVGRHEARRIQPIDGVLLGAVLLALAAAGPTWSRIPNPLVADTAPLVVALKVTTSMQSPDLAPTRADRARFKILDLIDRRAGARTALVAYAGTAHRVAPLTEDPNILRPLLEGLTPAAMPLEGQNAGAALGLAGEILADAGTAGAVLFVLDDLDPSDIAAFNAATDPPRPPVLFLVMLPEGQALAQLERIEDATTVHVTPDDRDIARIERKVRAAYAAALADDDRLQWKDRGGLLAWPAALLAVLWFRRGWTMRWGIAGALALGLGLPAPAHADGWADWFLTPDQQGMIAFRNKNFGRAAELFEDPLWRGHALSRSGQYAEAAEVFARIDSAEAAFAEGNARMRNREYRPAIAAYETALARRPDYPEAAHNLEVARATVEYVETAREQSDTGEDSGIGADDVVFDNKEARGTDTQIEGKDKDAAPLSAEQWLSSIDTDMTDFLRSRFLLENAQAGQ